MEALRQGTAATRETVAIRLSRAAHGHSSDAYPVVNVSMVELNEGVRVTFDENPTNYVGASSYYFFTEIYLLNPAGSA